MTKSNAVPERLIGAARELFPRHGFAGTSVRAITARARANLGAVTYHFGSKEGLYHAAIEAMTEPLGRRMASAPASAARPLDRIEAMARAFLEHVTVQPEAPAIVLRELAGGRPLPPPIARTMRANFAAIAEAVRAGQKDGSIRSGDPRLLTFTVVAQPFYVAVAGRLLEEILGLDPHDPATRARIIDHAVKTIRAALAAPVRARP